MLNELQREGHELDPADVATLSPYLTRHIRRFGDFVLDLSPAADLPEARLELNGAFALEKSRWKRCEPHVS